MIIKNKLTFKNSLRYHCKFYFTCLTYIGLYLEWNNQNSNKLNTLDNTS